jgi:serine/threonine protein kinase
MAPSVEPDQSDAVPMLPDAIKELAKYEVEKKIGKGQFSTVFRARNTQTNVFVALKTMQVLRAMIKGHLTWSGVP